jgi:hypothetical protein
MGRTVLRYCFFSSVLVFVLAFLFSSSLHAQQETTPPPPLMLQGHLQVNVNLDAARVIVNGKEMGVAQLNTPLNLRNVAAGAVRVRVEAEGYAPIERTVEIAVGVWKQEAFILYPTESASPPSSTSARLASEAPEPPSPIVASPPRSEEPPPPFSGEARKENKAPQKEEEAKEEETTEHVPDDPQAAKAYYVEQAEAARQAERWARAETYYERALEIDPQDNVVNAALFAVKEARWKEEGQSVVMLASSRMQLIMFTPYRSQLSLVPRQTRFFAVQVKALEAGESLLRYQWQVDGRPVSGRETYEFVHPAVGVHEVAVVVEAPSGARLSKSWTVDVREEKKAEAEANEGARKPMDRWAPLYPPRVEVFDVKDSIVSVDQKQLTVTGKVRNLDADVAENVIVWVTALDSSGRAILRRLGVPKPQPLGPHEVGLFAVSMENQPAVVRFHLESISN